MREISKGVWLMSKEELIEEQKHWHEEDLCKEKDFSQFDFWVVTDNGIVQPSLWEHQG